MGIPILDLSLAKEPASRKLLLCQLHDALFNVGFLYVKNHGVPSSTISNLTDLLPTLFALPERKRAQLSKLNSPHFLGYSGFAEETTLGKKDLREQFDYATELPVVWHSQYASNGGSQEGRDLSKLYWRLRGPNQWPDEEELPGFRGALTGYHDALSELSYRLVHLVEEAFEIPVGTLDRFFQSSPVRSSGTEIGNASLDYLPPQHRIKLLKYPAARCTDTESQGVGPHKDSSGWLTFLYQVGNEAGLEVLGKDGTWIPAPPTPDTFVINFGNAFEAATEGAVRATVHRVKAPQERDRYSIPFFMGLPLDLTVSEIRSYIPEAVRKLRSMEDKSAAEKAVSPFLDPRWDELGESQLRKWIRSHEDVGKRWYGDETVAYYMS